MTILFGILVLALVMFALVKWDEHAHGKPHQPARKP